MCIDTCARTSRASAGASARRGITSPQRAPFDEMPTLLAPRALFRAASPDTGLCRPKLALGSRHCGAETSPMKRLTPRPRQPATSPSRSRSTKPATGLVAMRATSPTSPASPSSPASTASTVSPDSRMSIASRMSRSLSSASPGSSTSTTSLLRLPASGARSDAPVEDPFLLRRFTEQQKFMHAKAVNEVRRGKKESCWMWFVVPTPPYIANGVEEGSPNNRRYAIRSDEEAMAYLQFRANGVDLRHNYIEVMAAIKDQLAVGKNPFGSVDAPKLRSSLKLFQRIARDMSDESLHGMVRDVLLLLRAKRQR